MKDETLEVKYLLIQISDLKATLDMREKEIEELKQQAIFSDTIINQLQVSVEQKIKERDEWKKQYGIIHKESSEIIRDREEEIAELKEQVEHHAGLSLNNLKEVRKLQEQVEDSKLTNELLYKERFSYVEKERLKLELKYFTENRKTWERACEAQKQEFIYRLKHVYDAYTLSQTPLAKYQP